MKAKDVIKGIEEGFDDNEQIAGAVEWVEDAANRLADFEQDNHVQAIKIEKMQAEIDQLNAELEKLKTRQITDEMTEPVKQVLSMMVFQFIRMVQIYRQAGFNIPKKAEEEQAFCMHRFLIAALEHGENWKNVVHGELKEMVEKLETAK